MPAHKTEALIAELAARRHGIVIREQLLAAGITVAQVERLIGAGYLIVVHPGVYLVGHRAVAPWAYETAAVLACRPRALLGHRSAARLGELPVPAGGPIEVIVVGRNRRSLKGLRVRSLKSLASSELRWRHGLPLTSPSLTLLDLAGDLSRPSLAAALNEARVQRLVNDRELRATLERHPNRRGARALRALLDEERGPQITRSEAERRALELMLSHGIAPDASDTRVGPYRLDFYFREERLAVEVDGYRYHGTPKRFVDDRRRAAFLAARGIQTFPLTWHDLGPNSRQAMAELEATLAERQGRRGAPD